MTSAERAALRTKIDGATRQKIPKLSAEGQLDTRAGQDLLARLTDATCDLYEHRHAHARRIALKIIMVRGHA